MRPVTSGSTRSPDAAARYVLNLRTSTTPEAVREVAGLPDLKRFTFFTTRSFEGGRERFRLHMGYFATLEDAQRWLPTVRNLYPAAWAGQAPAREQSLAGPMPALPARIEPAATAAAAVPAASAQPARPPAVRAAGPVPGRNVPSLPAAPRPPVLGAAATRGNPALSDSGVLRVLEDRQTRAGLADARVPVRRPPEPRPTTAYFAVQLGRGPEPLEIEDVPPIPILDQYTLYTVEGVRDGARWYALRVGFFTDVAAAKGVALQVRSEFAALSIVAISESEKRIASGEEGSVEQVPAPVPGRARAARWTPSPEEVNFGDARPHPDPEDSLDQMLSASGEYAAGILQQSGARRRRSLRSRPFFRLLERLGGRIKGF